MLHVDALIPHHLFKVDHFIVEFLNFIEEGLSFFLELTIVFFDESIVFLLPFLLFVSNSALKTFFFHFAYVSDLRDTFFADFLMLSLFSLCFLLNLFNLVFQLSDGYLVPAFLLIKFGIFFSFDCFFDVLHMFDLLVQLIDGSL